MESLTKSIIQKLLKPRSVNSNKGTHGHALIIAGNKYKMGSAVIAAKASLRAGVGLLTVNIPEEERLILQTAIPEAMLMSRTDYTKNINDFSAVGIGPGIGQEKDEIKILIHYLQQANIPVLLDADALNIIANDKNIFSFLKEGSIITPHPKEFDRLFGEHENSEDRINTAIQKSQDHKIVIVLKDAKTMITYKGESFENTTGNAGLAKGGSGDALSGIITAFLAQGYDAFDAAKIGVYLHGLAADFAKQHQSLESMLITDIIECLGKAFKESLPSTSGVMGFKTNK